MALLHRYDPSNLLQNIVSKEGRERGECKEVSMSYLSPTFSFEASSIPSAVEITLISESELLATNTIGNSDLQVTKQLSVRNNTH